MGFLPAGVSMWVISGKGGLIWFLEPASLQNKAVRIIWSMDPDLGLKCDSMGRNGKERPLTIFPTVRQHFGDGECG